MSTCAVVLGTMSSSSGTRATVPATFMSDWARISSHNAAQRSRLSSAMRTSIGCSSLRMSAV